MLGCRIEAANQRPKMSTLAELLAQRQALEKQIAAMQGEARTEAIAKCKALMAEHGLTVADISANDPAVKAKKAERSVVPVKYRDNRGNSWTGRGLKPKWLAAALESGRNLEDFAV